MPSPPPGSDWIDYFGLFGVHGSTAWFGIVDEGLVQAGQTVLISAAAGAIGSLCVQIAKARGARVIGLAGSAEKCRKVESLGADVCINYKADDVSERLKAIAPDGIHMYFDNVGGETLEAAIDNMAHYGRIVFCGAISQYNDDQMGGPGNFQQILYKELTLKGYLVATYMGRMEESIGALAQMKASGQIRMDLDVRHGIENALGALNSLFDGSNTGKVVLQVSSFEA